MFLGVGVCVIELDVKIFFLNIFHFLVKKIKWSFSSSTCSYVKRNYLQIYIAYIIIIMKEATKDYATSTNQRWGRISDNFSISVCLIDFKKDLKNGKLLHRHGTYCQYLMTFTLILTKLFMDWLITNLFLG